MELSELRGLKFIRRREMGRLMKGDCLERMKEIPDSSIDMVLTDPPYGTTQNKWDSVIDLDSMWKELKRITKPTSAICLMSQTPFDKVLGASNIKMLKYEWIWHKNKGTGHLNAKKMPMKNHENILVFYKKAPVYNSQKTTGNKNVSSYKQSKANSTNYGNSKQSTYKGGTERHPLSIIPIPVINNDGSGEERFHPTQKPTPLMEHFILTYTNEGETVLDFTMGSGTTGVACVNTGRDFIGIEMDDEYFNIAKDRILKAKEIA